MFSYSNKLRVIYMKLLKWKITQDKENNSMFYFSTNIVCRNTEYRLWVY